MNNAVSHIVNQELKNRGIVEYNISDHIVGFSKNEFTIKKNTNEILFVYEQKYFIQGGYSAGDVQVELFAEPTQKTYSKAMLSENVIDTIFMADSNIEVFITANNTIDSVFKYVKIKPIKTIKIKDE